MAKYIRDVVRFTVALTPFQEHRYLHCTSSFKKGKKKGMSATICRYGMPRKLRHVTVVNADGVELRRLHGNEFINGYSSLITKLTHSNHDLRFVFGPEADYYLRCCICDFSMRLRLLRFIRLLQPTMACSPQSTAVHTTYDGRKRKTEVNRSTKS